MPMRPLARDDLDLRGSAVVASWQVAADRRRTRGVPVAPVTPPVTHSYAALAFYTEGRARVEQNGEFTLSEGDVLLVPAGSPHRMLEVIGAKYWGLRFCAPCFAADGAAPLLEPFERVREGASAVVHVPGARRAFLQTLFRELEARSGDGGGDAADAVRRSLLTLILDEVERATSQNGSAEAAARGVRRGVVTESLRFIERNCLRRVTLHHVAKAVSRSPAYVTNALTRATGRSAGEWIVSGKMAEARRLLLHSDERIDSIAERVGYSDATHFIRMFRRAHGDTPAAWRSRLNGPSPGRR